MKVRFTHSAKSDLDSIGAWIAADDPERAAAFGLEIYDQCMRIAEHPLAWPRLSHGRSRVLRKVVFGDYVIVYSIVRSTVVINHIVHGRRDLDRLLAPPAR